MKGYPGFSVLQGPEELLRFIDEETRLVETDDLDRAGIAWYQNGLAGRDWLPVIEIDPGEAVPPLPVPDTEEDWDGPLSAGAIFPTNRTRVALPTAEEGSALGDFKEPLVRLSGTVALQKFRKAVPLKARDWQEEAAREKAPTSLGIGGFPDGSTIVIIRDDEGVRALLFQENNNEIRADSAADHAWRYFTRAVERLS